MKMKTRLFLCLSALLILLSLTSCSGLLATKPDKSGKGRIEIDFGNARAVNDYVTEYSVYLCPTSESRTEYEHYLMGMMASSAARISNSIPEGAIYAEEKTLSQSYEVETGKWLVFVTAFIDMNGDDTELYGFATTQVKADATSSVTLAMCMDYEYEEKFGSSFSANFEDTLYFIATKDTYEEGRDTLLVSPDESTLPKLDLGPDPEDMDEEEVFCLFFDNLFGKGSSCYKLVNIKQKNGKLYADIVKISYTGSADSILLSGGQIKYVTDCGVQIEGGSTDYFLFTPYGLDWYMEWYSFALIFNSMKEALKEELKKQPSLLEEMLAEWEPEPIEAEIHIADPASLEEIADSLGIVRPQGRMW